MEEHVFRMYDINNDGRITSVSRSCSLPGVISMEEFLLVFHVLSSGTPEDNLIKIFRIFDVNNDGTISMAEMEKLVKDMHVLLGVSKCFLHIFVSSLFVPSYVCVSFLLPLTFLPGEGRQQGHPGHLNISRDGQKSGWQGVRIDSDMFSKIFF